MAAGDLPPGYTVKKRRLVKVKKSAQQGMVVAVDAAPGKKKKSKKNKKNKRAKVSLAA